LPHLRQTRLDDEVSDLALQFIDPMYGADPAATLTTQVRGPGGVLALRDLEAAKEMTSSAQTR